MKQSLLITIFISLIYSQSLAQEPTRYTFKKQTINNQVSHTLTGEQTIVVNKPKLVKSGQYERSVQVGDETYRIDMDKKKKQVTLSESGQSIGTLWYKGTKKMDVTLPDGTVYDWQKTSGRSWKYVVNGKEVVACKFVKESGKKYLEYNVSENVEAVMLVSHVYGVDLIQNKANQPMYWGMAIGLVAMRAAIGSTDSGSDF